MEPATRRRTLAGAILSLLTFLVLAPTSAAHAQSLHIAGDFDYAATLSETDVQSGGGAGLRIGSEFDLVVLTLIPELAGGYHEFSGQTDAKMLRGMAGARLRVGKILEPGIFAHVGVVHDSAGAGYTAPGFDAGLALDLTLLPLLDAGAHVAYNAVLGSGDHERLGFLTAGLHAALVL